MSKKLFLLLLPIFVGLTAWSQQPLAKVAGIVYNEKNEPLSKVTVSLVGLAATTTTDSQGKYSIESRLSNFSLRFKLVGYKTETVALTVAKGTELVKNIVLRPDGNEVYFTLSRIPSKINRKKNGPSTVNIEIYSSRKNGDSWSEPKSFRYNNVLEWSVGDPFLSADGKQLYFISNMPGGKGGTDIYVCNRTADGNWGAALNLFMVNSIGNERTPFVDGEMMYFSSDAGINMGGLDIFKANSKTGLVVNMGYPINSPQDDFAFILTGKQKGYFSSNRDGGLGSDDIYSFDNMRAPYILLKDQLVNIEDQKPIPNAVITFKKAGGIPLKTQADAEGNYTVRLEEGADYEISIAKTGFRTAVVEVKANDHRDDIKLPHSLVPIVIDLPIKIENIYYDFNQSKIRKDAAVELDKLALLMRQNPTIWIELSSHTDSRGSDQLNMALSTARAEAAVKYLIARGIDKYRIKAVGYGETRLVNNCKNGVWCPIEEHKKNRRTEFTIVKQ